MIESLFVEGKLQIIPKVYPNMSISEFVKVNRDLVYYVHHELGIFDIECTTKFLYSYLTNVAPKIKKLRPSNVITFPADVMAKNFMNIKYKQGMLYFPVWSKNDNNFLLFFVGMR